jgi:outer membrane protein
MKKNHVRTPTLAIFLAGALAIPLCHGDPQPLYELGIGAGGMSLPDYRGSDERQNIAFPIPYFVYRGKFLKADRDGVRTDLYSSDKVLVNLSVNGTLPVNSSTNKARSGMLNLKPTLELGPTANVNLWESSDRKSKIDFRLPLRMSIAIQSSPEQVGWLTAPSLNLDVIDPDGANGWKLGILAGPLFNTRRYNSYFYSVSPAEATAVRPAYSAPGGYAGSQLTFAMSKRYPHYWVGGFLRYDTVANAAFESSPLVKKRNGVSAGFAVSWVFTESSTLVDRKDD